MPVNKTHSIASPAEKKDIMPKTVLDAKGEEKQELKPTLSISTQKRTPSMKEAKPKKVEWQ
jgi:hypothetical protein